MSFSDTAKRARSRSTFTAYDRFIEPGGIRRTASPTSGCCPAISSKLPEVVGRPETFVPSGARRRIVGTGATLTAVSLVLGSLLALLGLIDAISSGFDGLSIAIIVVGAILVMTHWGWVHVAELTANSIEGRGSAEVDGRRRQWLATIEPYTHYEINTRVEDDGAITI